MTLPAGFHNLIPNHEPVYCFFLTFNIEKSKTIMVTSKTIANGILRSIGILAAIFVGLFFVYKIQSVLIYLFIALIVSMIASPVVYFFKRKLRFPHIAAVIVTLILFLSLLAGFIMLFVPLIISQSDNLSLLDTAQLEKDVMNLYERSTAYLGEHNIDAKKMMSQGGLTSKLNFNFIPNFINGLLGILSGFGIGLASVLFITFFFLKDRKMFAIGAKKLLPEAHEEKILNSFRKINYLLSRYFIGLILQMTILFTLYLTVLLIFGVQNAFIIAFITALLNIIPYIGPLIATALVIILTLLGNMDSPEQMFTTTQYVFIGYCLCQTVDNNVSTPLIFSNSVNSHPLEIFLVILASGFVFGILGMIIAVPMYTVIKVIAKEFFPQNPVVRMLAKDI
jgi:predicted PurR-regulated permease PerM